MSNTAADANVTDIAQHPVASCNILDSCPEHRCVQRKHDGCNVPQTVPMAKAHDIQFLDTLKSMVKSGH